MKLLPALLIAAVSTGLIPNASSDAFAQLNRQPQQAQPKAPPTQKGTVAEVKKKGRLTSLMILSEGGGAPFEVIVSPKVQFYISVISFSKKELT